MLEDPQQRHLRRQDSGVASPCNAADKLQQWEEVDLQQKQATNSSSYSAKTTTSANKALLPR